MAKESGRNRTCSLTSEQLAAQQAAAEQGEKSNDEKFTSTGTFKACIAADMVVYKLGGFVSDHDAEILEVDPKKVEIRVGKRTLLGGWGRHKSKQPVHVVIQFGEQQVGANRGPMAASRQVEVQVTIIAIGLPTNDTMFQRRAIELLKNLRRHFAAD